LNKTVRYGVFDHAQKYQLALKWYRLAAEQGHVEPQFLLGLCYQDGQEVERDYAEAVKWHKLSTGAIHSW